MKRPTEYELVRAEAELLALAGRHTPQAFVRAFYNLACRSAVITHADGVVINFADERRPR